MKKSIAQMMILLIIFLLLPLAVVSAETSLYDGIEVTTLPHNFSGLVVKGIEFGTCNKVTLTVENQTVYAVSSMSNIAYICYNQSGENVKSGLVFLEALKNNETCEVSFDLENGTAKIAFYNPTIYSQTGEAYNKHCNHNYILVNGRYACSLCGEVMENNPHRLILTAQARMNRMSQEKVLKRITDHIKVPS